MSLIITPSIEAKIGRDDHGQVTVKEVLECFENHCGGYCIDAREQHRTHPPTLWFVAETHHRRRLKIIFVRDGDNLYLKSAYPANDEVARIFSKYASAE